MMLVEDNMRKYLLLLLILIGCKTENISIEKKVDQPGQISQVNEQAEKISIPDEFQLSVPFVPQAPFANWDVHNDSCEEAGILLAHYFYSQQSLTKDVADAELKEMINFQNDNYGGQKDIFGEGISKLAKDFYGYEPRVVSVDIERIKEEIYSGNPVILMTTAAYLKPEKNDYPEMGYHVIDAVGYNQYGIIAHDVGTITGENTFYSNQTIMNAIADYDNLAVILK